MDKTIKLGILAGMGPRSTSPFVELVLDECQKQYNAKYDIDFPHMIIYSLPTPFYIDRNVNDEQLSKSIKEGLNYLADTGVDMIAIPCNSAHKYFDEIVSNVDVPILNIINETMKSIKTNSNVTIFATELTVKSDLYQAGIEEAGCNYIFEDNWQLKVNELISEIKLNGASENALTGWNDLKSLVQSENVDTVILACTDLNVVSNKNDGSLKIIDSSLELAKALIREYIKIK